MKSFNLINPSKRDSKVTKTFDLKYLGILSNSVQNNKINFQNLNEDKNLSYVNEIKIPKINEKDEKIKYILSNKSINNSLTSNYFFPIKKKSHSYSKFKSTTKKELFEIDKINKDDKTNGIKNSDKNLFLNSQTIEQHNNNKTNSIIDFTKPLIKSDDLDKYDSLPIFKKNSKRKDIKKFFIVNKKLNEKINFCSPNTKSVKSHITLQSTIPTFSPILTPEKDSQEKKLREKSQMNKNNESSKSNNDSKINNLKKFSALIKHRKNYPFVLNPKPFVPKKFNGLPLSVIKMNNKYSNILKKENEKVFRQYFSIIGKEKFSKKFQNIVNKYEIKEKDEKKNDTLVNENIISGTKLLKEIHNEEKRQKNILVKTNKKYLFYKFKKAMILLFSKIDSMTVYIGEILKNYKTPKSSYGFHATRDLFFAIKSKNFKLANSILDSNKFIVLDYDYFNMTALHWAAKYNFYQIIPKIVEYGSHIDKQNYIGETPLLIAVKHKFIESTVFLSLYLASPFIRDNKGYNCLDYCKNEFKMKNIIQKVIFLHYISMLGPTKNASIYISSEFIEYIVNENKGDMELEAYNIVKEKYEYYKRKNNK